MGATATRVPELRAAITAEASKAMGLKPGSWRARLFTALFWLPAQRFARLGAAFDQCVAQDGLTSAMRWLLPRFASQVEVSGEENIPRTGPLLIISNHPGAFDGLVILAQVPRSDIKVIVSDVPFTRGMQAASRHMIYSTGNDMGERMSAVRQSMRHLQDGGALMLFPTGLVDPDPSFMPGAEEALGGWSNSLSFFLRRAPQTLVLPVIVSGVIAPRYYNNPIARQQKTVRARQKVAEYFEIALLMVIRKDLGLTPRVSFGKPLSPAELGTGEAKNEWQAAIIQHARCLLREHTATV